MRELRRLSANALSIWPPEALLDYVLRACMDAQLGSFEDEWDPQQVLASTGFKCLIGCESVLAFGVEPNGDATLRVACTHARAGGGDRREEILLLESGEAHLRSLREKLQEQLRRPGNCHWGTQFDVKSLSEALDLGVLLFCNRLQRTSTTCLYNIGAVREDFPYWISLWWHEPVHFRLAEVLRGGENADLKSATYTSFWSRKDLPPTLLAEYRRCNRLAN